MDEPEVDEPEPPLDPDVVGYVYEPCTPRVVPVAGSMNVIVRLFGSVPVMGRMPTVESPKGASCDGSLMVSMPPDRFGPSAGGMG